MKGKRETKDHLGERNKAGWKRWNVARAVARSSVGEKM